MSADFDKMTDDDHLRYMISLGDRAVIDQLHETKDSWTFGGPLWICKDQPLYKDGRGVHPLIPESHFYVTHFTLKPDGAGLLAAKVHGVALWFQMKPQLPTHRLGESRTLSGWVPAEREAELTKWVTFLNGEIAARLRDAPTPWPPPIDPDDHLRRSLAFFTSLGLPVPQAATMDEFMDKLGELSNADAPIDARPKTSKP